jgi:hypothetical protein
MFFDKDYEPEIVLDDKIERLEEDLEIGERILNPSSLPERWAYFSYLKGLEAGLNDMYSVNFGYTISSFIAGMGVDAGTDVYFKIGMDEAIFDIYEEVRKQYENEENVVKQFFNKVLEWYKSEDGACNYEKAVYLHNVSCPSQVREYVKENNLTMKKFIIRLLEGTVKAPTINAENDDTISFRLTYSEEEKWVRLEGDDDPSKLRNLIQGDI